MFHATEVQAGIDPTSFYKPLKIQKKRKRIHIVRQAAAPSEGGGGGTWRGTVHSDTVTNAVVMVFVYFLLCPHCLGSRAIIFGMRQIRKVSTVPSLEGCCLPSTFPPHCLSPLSTSWPTSFSQLSVLPSVFHSFPGKAGQIWRGAWWVAGCTNTAEFTFHQGQRRVDSWHSPEILEWKQTPTGRWWL